MTTNVLTHVYLGSVAVSFRVRVQLLLEPRKLFVVLFYHYHLSLPFAILFYHYHLSLPFAILKRV
jgi:hypothetical protein